MDLIMPSLSRMPTVLVEVVENGRYEKVRSKPLVADCAWAQTSAKIIASDVVTHESKKLCITGPDALSRRQARSSFEMRHIPGKKNKK
jgi:hypothetical protein